MRIERGSERQRRRFKVTIGGAVSFTTDVSAGGFCTETMRVLEPGSAIEGAIDVEGKHLPFVGRVAWAVPGDCNVNLRGRMGIAFTGGSRQLLEILLARGAA